MGEGSGSVGRLGPHPLQDVNRTVARETLWGHRAERGSCCKEGGKCWEIFMTLSVLLTFKPHANIIVIIHLVKYKLITGGYNTNCNVMTLVINFF